MENKKFKKVLTSVLAVVLAFAMLIGGGTYAYLQSSTEDVKNSFATNSVEVKLAETTGDKYNIVPGTEQAKDPKVTVKNTVDAYVYVEVKDNTQGLITYAIADGWAKLDGYDNIYYREVLEDADVKEFSVLAGDKVSYSKDLTNEDMKGKYGVSLTFNATASQKEPWNNPSLAYAGADILATNTTELKNSLSEAKDGEVIALSNKFEWTEQIVMPTGKSVVIDGNGQTIEAKGNSAIYVPTGAKATIKDVVFSSTVKGTQAINVNGDVVVDGCKTTSSKIAHLVYTNSATTSVVIRNCESSRPLINMVEKKSDCNVLIENNVYTSNALFDVYPITFSGNVSNVTIKNNYGKYSSFMVRAKDNVTNYENVVFEGNTYKDGLTGGELIKFENDSAKQIFDTAFEKGAFKGLRAENGKYYQQ